MNARTIVITGGSAGVGRALAVRASRAGYGVVAVGRNVEALAKLAAQITGEGGALETVVAELGDAQSARRIVAAALSRFGRIDVLVNNAGEVAAGRLIDQRDAALKRQFRTHAIAPLSLVREALDALRATRGLVVMVGSGVARVPVGGMGAYPASKAALRSATAVLRRELKPDGIAVTYVDPGAIDTAFMRRAGMPGAPKRFLVSPEIVARAIFHATARRPRELNAVPYQTALVALAERFPRLTDALLERFPSLVGGEVTIDAVPASTTEISTPTVAAAPATPAPLRERLGEALEPLARRMERLKLSPSFIEGILEPDARLDVGEVAMRWAGMPNKNERAMIAEIFDALTDAGILTRVDDTHWAVHTPREP